MKKFQKKDYSDLKHGCGDKEHDETFLRSYEREMGLSRIIPALTFVAATFVGDSMPLVK